MSYEKENNEEKSKKPTGKTKAGSRKTNQAGRGTLKRKRRNFKANSGPMGPGPLDPVEAAKDILNQVASAEDFQRQEDGTIRALNKIFIGLMMSGFGEDDAVRIANKLLMMHVKLRDAIDAMENGGPSE